MNSRQKIRAEVDILKEKIDQLENENMALKSQLVQQNGIQCNATTTSEEEDEENADTTNICEIVENYFDFNGHAVQL